MCPVESESVEFDVKIEYKNKDATKIMVGIVQDKKNVAEKYEFM